MLKKGFILILFLISSFGLNAQIVDVGRQDAPEKRKGSSILDDSTQQVYGPKTSRFTYERLIKLNTPKYYNIDTSINNLHKHQTYAKYDYQLQNLGNIGTAANYIYPQIPDVVGRRSGFTLYDPYMLTTDDIRYFDTKSPYTSFNIIWGGEGRARTDVIFTRNIDERSNFGFDYRGLFIDKQIQRSGRGDRRTQSVSYRLFGNYKTKDDRYKIFGSLVRNKHNVDEYGGIEVDESAPLEDQYFDDNRAGQLTGVVSQELRTNLHFYQEYRLTDLLQLYSSVDRYKQQNDFIDEGNNDDFFDVTFIDSTDVKDRSKLITRNYEVGMKGDLGIAFYSLYYKARDVDFNYKFLDLDSVSGVDGRVLESYGGFTLRFGNDSTRNITAFGEYLLGGNFKVGGSIDTDWFFVKGSTGSYLPSYIHRAYYGTHDRWTNDFSSTVITNIEGYLKINLSNVEFYPGLKNTLYSNYTYFQEVETSVDSPQRVLPTQASGEINLLIPSLRFKWNFLNNFHLNGNVNYTLTSGPSANAISIPDFHSAVDLYYERISFEGNLEWQLGVTSVLRSTYFADAYDPAIMQFYRQNTTEVEMYPIFDVFFNAKINRARFFIKYNNITELVRGTGYFMTPEYPAQGPILDFGFEWAFYN